MHYLKAISGPLAALLILWLEPDPVQLSTNLMAAMVVWMVCWWVLQVVPLGVTALLPVVWYPLTGIMSAEDAARQYMNPVIFLFAGGFLVAFAMEKWHLHQRIALGIIGNIGLNPAKVLLGFMISSWFLSMWISNTATTIVLLTPAMALIYQLDSAGKKSGISGEQLIHRNFTTGLLLGIAYAASIGGAATLIGSPPNLILAGLYQSGFQDVPTITFLNWFVFAFPVSIVLFILCYLYLYRMFARNIQFSVNQIAVLQESFNKIGRATREEKIVIVAFVTMVFLWFTRTGIDLGSLTLPGWQQFLPYGAFIHDGTVAVLVALILFLIPANSVSGIKDTILGPNELQRLPLNVIFLFGGGFAMAHGFTESGLSEYLAGHLSGLAGLPPFLLILLITIFMVFLTEITSNTAVAQFMLPVIIVMSQTLELPPYLLTIPATLVASYAFMLPVATPPNTIIFGTDRITVPQMAGAGFVMNLAGAALVTLAGYYVAGWIFG